MEPIKFVYQKQEEKTIEIYPPACYTNGQVYIGILSEKDARRVWRSENNCSIQALDTVLDSWIRDISAPGWTRIEEGQFWQEYDKSINELSMAPKLKV